MSNKFTGKVEIQDNAENTTIELDGNTANIFGGGSGKDGEIRLNDGTGNIRFLFRGKDGVMHANDGAGKNVLSFNSHSAALRVGAKGNSGLINLRDGAGRNVLRFNGTNGLLRLGIKGNGGYLYAYNKAGDVTFIVDGDKGNIRVLSRIDGVNRMAMWFNAIGAILNIGAKGNEGEIRVMGEIIVRDGAGTERIRLDGNTGDIRLQGADCAEEFDVTETERIDPGTVLVIDDERKLQSCSKPYDKRVAGVVSGGNGSNPGIILDKNSTQNKRLPIALNGKVYCKVDAQYSPIEVGDLLTTSSTSGHAMKAADPSKAFGAVIGKALHPLREGKGLIPILAALQ